MTPETEVFAVSGYQKLVVTDSAKKTHALSLSSVYLCKQVDHTAKNALGNDVLYCHTTFNTADRKTITRRVGEARDYTSLPL